MSIVCDRCRKPANRGERETVREFIVFPTCSGGALHGWSVHHYHRERHEAAAIADLCPHCIDGLKAALIDATEAWWPAPKEALHAR